MKIYLNMAETKFWQVEM